ncbi:AAA domain [Paraburkholderia caribensis MBA4]|uniref:AAA domain n=1 Tax=Paraburkholderia caribensis MBA4 TaxID=1323664 RepID=A0A0P0RHN9_9BURK|nr:AAA family ATPase [Paraburkholderia caribensis]ALL68242.1 AAA domain [Paraburkholderia caribensis MBA4]
MHIEGLWITHFRGIESLEWRPARGLNCLIGPGDSGKTTVLDAIELLFAERQNASFHDLDFYDADTSRPISICAVLSGLPAEFLRDDRYGLLVSGWNPATGQWEPEPAEHLGVKPVLSLQLDVDSTLEPTWSIYVERNGTGDKSRRMSFADRRDIAPARLGVYADRHLSWGRGSSLQRVGSHPEALPATLNTLLRSARDNFAADSATAFSEIVNAIAPDIAKLGVRVRSALTANLDHTSFSMNTSGVALHDGNVPLRFMGTGSSRLAVAALQSAETAHRQFLLVDELEFGLEPHRISLLVSHLRQRVSSSGQAFITSHSTAVLREVRFAEAFVCRRDSSDGTVQVVPAAATATPVLEAKRYIRDKGEALLGKTLLVCEGQTEIGLLKGFAEGIDKNFQAAGVVLVDGGGDPSSFSVALHFARMGYRTAVLTDSDRPTDAKTQAELQAYGIPHFQWGLSRCTEEELFCGLPAALLPGLLELIADAITLPRLLQELSRLAGLSFNSLAEVTPHLSSPNVVKQIGLQANRSKWIKNHFDLCFDIGNSVLSTADLLGEGSFDSHLQNIVAWLTRDD